MRCLVSRPFCCAGAGHAKRPRHQTAHLSQFWPAQSRRLSQGIARDAVRGEVATSGHRPYRCCGSVSGTGRRRTRPGRSHRPQFRSEGYRKALRAMRFAEKWQHPVIALIDVVGAYPGLGAEERGQAEAIAHNLREMARLKVPFIAAITGEGGSGGALAIAVADRVLMLENSIYSVISPEGCASIMWRDSNKKEMN